MEPDTSYALLDGDRIAYQVVGDGPIDLVMSRGMFSTLDSVWSTPGASSPYARLAGVCRLILFDRLGTGWSDAVPLTALPPLEGRWREVETVMDAAHSDRAIVMGMQDGGPPAMFGAATVPNRVIGLILFHSPARFRRGDDYPMGFDDDTIALWRKMMSEWELDAMLDMSYPSRHGDEEFLSWGRRTMRSMASPTAMLAYIDEMVRTDVRELLPSIRVPTMVLHRSEYRWVDAALDRFVADHIADARYVEVPGGDADLFFDGSARIVEAILGFVTEIEPRAKERRLAERMLATILFTDIADSTLRARAEGDADWVKRLQLHDDLSRDVVSRHGGRVVKTTGDGVLATFDGPGRGLLAANALSSSLDRHGLPVRSGLHTGEIELRGNDVAGVGVHIAARVMAEAGASEVLVSRTVCDLVAGSDFRFVDRGLHHLKGIEGDWQLFALVGG